MSDKIKEAKDLLDDAESGYDVDVSLIIAKAMVTIAEQMVALNQRMEILLYHMGER